MIEIWRAFRGRELSTFVRWMEAILAVGLWAFAWDPLTDSDGSRYSRPVFDIVREMAPLEWWGAGFAIASVLALAAAISGRFLVYIAAMILAGVLELSWFMAIIWDRYVNGSALTSGGVGLWIMSLGLTFGTLLYPRPIKAEERVQLETETGDVVPLRRVHQ